MSENLLARQLCVRPLVCASVAMLCGACLVMAVDVPIWLMSGTGAAGIVGCVLFIRQKRGILPWVMLLTLCLGMGRMALEIRSFPQVETMTDVKMVGWVESEPFINENGRLVARFNPQTIDGQPSSLRLRLYLRGDIEAFKPISYGTLIQLTGSIWKREPVTNPYEFDFTAYLHRNGMDAVATAEIEEVTVLGAKRDLYSLVTDLRRAAAARIDQLFPRSAAVVRALVLGDRSMIDEELRGRFSATGTAHLIAISGLHVTLLAMAMSFLLRRFLSQRLSNLLALIPLTFYGILIGFSPPFTRALTMFAVLSLGVGLGLPADPLTRLSIALMGYLLFKPLSIADGGFVLSFAASAGLLLLSEPIGALLQLNRLPQPSPKLPRWRNLLRSAFNYLPGLLCASLAAQLSTLPAIVALFGTQSLISLPFNLICVPLCLLGYLIALPALVVSVVFYPLGALLASASDVLLNWMTRLLGYSANLPYASVRIGRYPLWLILIHCVIIIAASGLCAWPLKRRRFLPLTLIIVAGLSSLVTWIHLQPFRATFLDADEADCAVLQTEGRVYVFDTGDVHTPVADYLNATALNVDGVFLSHPHQDHAGGLLEILDSFRPLAIYVPQGWFLQEDTTDSVIQGIERAKAMNIPIVELKIGDALPLSESVRLTVYNPVSKNRIYEDVNDISLLLFAESGDHSILFTGDLTQTGEPSLLPDCDVLKVAHHGAENATSARFLQETTPEIAVISLGENNYGHPGDAVLSRLDSAGAEVLRTDQFGAITLTAQDGGFKIETFLEAGHELE